MAGVIAVGAVAFLVARKRTASLLGLQMKMPTASHLDRRLVGVSLMFGVGWGIAGFGPGAALVAFGADEGKALVFVVPRPRLESFVFGVLFGFLLQKGGVAKFEVLIGALLLTDFTVMKIMLTAIIVGMVGIFSMHAIGLVKLHVKPTRYASNILGGLLFGVGFALLGYCPGTGAAALGQGNYDAIAGVLGLIAGSHLYAETSGRLQGTLLSRGERGGIMLPDLVNMRLGMFLVGFVPMLAAALWAIELWTA